MHIIFAPVYHLPSVYQMGLSLIIIETQKDGFSKNKKKNKNTCYLSNLGLGSNCRSDEMWDVFQRQSQQDKLMY